MTENQALKQGKGLEAVDCTMGIGNVLALKDSQEVLQVRRAGQLAAVCMKDFVITELESTIDNDKKIKHSSLAEKTEESLLNPGRLKVLYQDTHNWAIVASLALFFPSIYSLSSSSS